jgi:MraZ protein
MLRGSYNARIDEKGRIKIPADFKQILDEKYGRPDYYVTSVEGDCAHIYPLQVWEEIESRLAMLPVMEPSKKKFLTRTSYYGQMQTMDGQGRILIHPLLRSEVALQGELMVVGNLTYLEVWSAERVRSKIKEEVYTIEDHEAMARHFA